MVRGDFGGVVRDWRDQLSILGLPVFRPDVRPVHPDHSRSELREHANVLDVRDHPPSDDTVEPLRHHRNGESGPGLSHRARYCPL